MLSLAIGREGQNARLAAKMTGWRIDIRSDAPPHEAAALPAVAPGDALDLPAAAAVETPAVADAPAAEVTP
jgi:transcription antitermination factor NusA-like protein